MPSPLRCLVSLLALLAAAPAGGADPLAVLRAFCQADGNGARIRAAAWSSIAPLVAWRLEPAWDHLHLIAGYEMGTPEQRDGAVEVKVDYTVVRTVRSDGARPDARVESRRYILEPIGDGGWQLRGPPPPPFVFESQADAAALVALLAPDDSPYLSNSAFVWQQLRDAGFDLPYADVLELPAAYGLRPERSANLGDLALYYDGGVPYHVGLIESDEGIVSAILNGGLRRTPFGAFAGEIRYLRPVSDADGSAAPSPTAGGERRE